MSQHARPVGPTTTNTAAPFAVAMAQGTAPPAQLAQRVAHIGPRPVGLISSQTTHVPATFAPDMVSDTRPQRHRQLLPPRSDYDFIPPDIDRFDSAMVQGWHPDSPPRQDLRLRTGMVSAQTTHVGVFSPEMVTGSHPDRFREFLPVRLGWIKAPDAQNDAAFSLEMVQGALVDRYRQLLPTRPGWSSSQPTHVVAFSSEMIGGHHPDRNREVLPLRIGWLTSQTTPVSAAVSLEMLAGWHPDRATFDRRVPIGWLAQTPDIALFSIEMVRGSMPERARILLASRIPLPLAQPTHVAAAFSPDMVQGAIPQRARVFRLTIGHATDVFEIVHMTPEVFAGWHPDRPRLFVAPKIALPLSQPSHVPAAFSPEMIAGHHPDSPRIFIYPKIGVSLAQTTHDEAAFSVEMFQGQVPELRRQNHDPRIIPGWYALDIVGVITPAQIIAMLGSYAPTIAVTGSYEALLELLASYDIEIDLTGSQ
jgi:hypothetical protein